MIILPLRYWMRTSLRKLPVPVLGLTFYKELYERLRSHWVMLSFGFVLTYRVNDTAEVVTFLLKRTEYTLIVGRLISNNPSFVQVINQQLLLQTRCDISPGL